MRDHTECAFSGSFFLCSVQSDIQSVLHIFFNLLKKKKKSDGGVHRKGACVIHFNVHVRLMAWNAHESRVAPGAFQ